MSASHLVVRSLQLGTLAVALCAGAVGARAGETSSTPPSDHRICKSELKSARQSVQSGRFVAASQHFVQCARDVCGESMAQECSLRNSELYSDLSSVVFLVTDPAGEPMTEVQVTMDGAPLTSHLDGLSVPVEAGPHEFSFSTAAGVFASQKIVLFRGERNRAITVVRPAPSVTSIVELAPTRLCRFNTRPEV